MLSNLLPQQYGSLPTAVRVIITGITTPVSSPPQSTFVPEPFLVITATWCLCIIVIIDTELTAPYDNTVFD
jgi:hypothetical protein